MTDSSSDLLELSGLFDIELLEASLDLIDRNRLKLYTTSSQIREIVEIQSSSRDGFSLKLFPNTNYCPCRYFRELVAQRHERFTCKHILATKLAIIGKQIQVEIVNDDLFSFLIKQIGEQLRTEIVV